MPETASRGKALAPTAETPDDARWHGAVIERVQRHFHRALFFAAVLAPFPAPAQTPVPPDGTPACLSPAELAALHAENRPLAESFCERGDARALERVRTLLRRLPHGRATNPDAPGRDG